MSLPIRSINVQDFDRRIWFCPLFLTKTRLHPNGIPREKPTHFSKSNDMSASPKPVSSEDILGQKVQLLLLKIIHFLTSGTFSMIVAVSYKHILQGGEQHTYADNHCGSGRPDSEIVRAVLTIVSYKPVLTIS